MADVEGRDAAYAAHMERIRGREGVDWFRGDLQEELKAVSAQVTHRRKVRPKIKWRELFEEIPNRYKSVHSFRSSVLNFQRKHE